MSGTGPLFGEWRVGRKVGRTIYKQTGVEATEDDPLIGVMDTKELAEEAVRGQVAVRALQAIYANAHAYHGTENGKANALNVIGMWAEDALKGRLHPSVVLLTGDSIYCPHGYVLWDADHPAAGLEKCPEGCTRQ